MNHEWLSFPTCWVNKSIQIPELKKILQAWLFLIQTKQRMNRPNIIASDLGLHCFECSTLRGTLNDKRHASCMSVCWRHETPVNVFRRKTEKQPAYLFSLLTVFEVHQQKHKLLGQISLVIFAWWTDLRRAHLSESRLYRDTDVT